MTSSTIKDVQTLLKTFYKERAIYIDLITNKASHKVYKAVLENNTYLIVRLSDKPDQIHNYLKEQWCANKVREIEIPSTEVLEVGNTAIPFAYSIAKEYYGIPGHKYLGDCTKMFTQIGEYMKKIHQVKTTAVGDRFDWSRNTLTKNISWEEYIERSFPIDEILKFYKQTKIITPENLKKLVGEAEKIKNWKFEPTLAHGKLLPQNVILNKDGDIIRIIDWKNARSGNSLYLDLSTTLNNCKKSERRMILDGYGMNDKEYEKVASQIDALYILRLRHMVRDFIESKNDTKLEPLKKKFNTILERY